MLRLRPTLQIGSTLFASFWTSQSVAYIVPQRLIRALRISVCALPKGWIRSEGAASDLRWHFRERNDRPQCDPVVVFARSVDSSSLMVGIAAIPCAARAARPSRRTDAVSDRSASDVWSTGTEGACGFVSGFRAPSNELRVCAARSRRRSPVGRTRGFCVDRALWRFQPGRLMAGPGITGQEARPEEADQGIAGPRRWCWPGRRHHLGQSLALGLWWRQRYPVAC